MHFVIDQISLLGLNAREIRTFTTMATFGQMNTLTIARRANLPRTTVLAILERLHRQGVVEKVSKGRRHEWLVDLERVGAMLHILKERLARSAVKDSLLDSDEFFVTLISKEEMNNSIEGASAQQVCKMYCTPKGILLTDLSGSVGVHIEHLPLRLKLSEALPSFLWSKGSDIEESGA